MAGNHEAGTAPTSKARLTPTGSSPRYGSEPPLLRAPPLG
jgi:hypothetical protein